MPAEKVVWGIDVGQCALKALKLQLVEGQTEAVAFDMVEHPKPLNPGERGGEELVNLIAQAIETLMSRNEMGGNSVVIGVPGYQAFTRFTKLPPVEKKQLPAIVQFEAGQQIPYDIDQVIWDYQIFSEEDSPDVEVGIFCMRTEQLDRYLGPFIEAGLQPVVVQPAPLALYNYMEHDAHRPGKATMLLDIGAESTDLIVSDRGSVWTRAIPIGGNNFTERLVEAFRLEFAKAESLKRSAATSKYARQVFQAMRPVYQDLVSEIQRSVGRYSQTHREAELDRVMGMGNGFRLPGLQKFLQQNLGMKVERVSAFNALQPGPSLNAPTLNENVLSLGVAYGLAVQGLGRGQIASNLLPPQIAKRATWRRKRPWFAATAACLVLAAASLWARFLLDNSALARNGGTKEISVQSPKGRKAIERALGDLASRAGDTLPREYTARTLAIARSASSEWTRLNTQVNAGRDKVEGMLALLADQTLWSRIVDRTHKALPAVDKELVEAGNLSDYLAVAKKIPRTERRQIILEIFETRYSPSVADEIGPMEDEEDEELGRGGRGSRAKRKSAAKRGGRGGRASGGRRAGRGAPVNRADGRGFLVTIRGYTPYKSSTIIDEFRERLLELGNPKDPKEAESLGFHILLPRKQVPNYRDPTKVGRIGRTTGANADEQIDPADLDPVTQEVWVGDWVFTMTFGVVLGVNPEASEAADGGRGKTGGAGRGKSRRGA